VSEAAISGKECSRVMIEQHGNNRDGSCTVWATRSDRFKAPGTYREPNSRLQGGGQHRHSAAVERPTQPSRSGTTCS